MIFNETVIRGAFIIVPERKEDARGFFARTWCRQEFEAQGLNTQLVQCNISFNARKGTLRGLHYQAPPHAEAKVVRCTMGAIHDIILDLRRSSSTYGEWVAVEITAENRQLLYVPEGVAHGFQTLEDNTEVSYQMGDYYHSDLAQGVRWDDPAFAINWPLANPIISERDRSFSLQSERT